ncbi:sensor histidine kinase [Actinoplanes utahensis]|uniref:histidine kinase n=1 Tax=Actinoplanes utahensis TaxID=1869 RepID=A0A0A6UF68_ACTUT|nr:sensor histidine kinase [Actinoplanes utahensis]KHD72959.1 histidine kinase [Actinoplanes utahensis]GIF31130.1 two-component sensor histidine kinase [Actinoplanes utahensis]
MIDVGRVAAWWRRLPVPVRDLPLALALALASLVPAVNSHGTQIGDVPTRPMDAFGIAVVAVECLPLAIRRRWPSAGLALVSLGFAADQLRGYHTLAATALTIALFSAGAHLQQYRRTTVVLVTVAYVLLTVALTGNGASESPAGFATFYAGMAVLWWCGSYLRTARVAEAERRRAVAEASRAAERARIARELHDVVTHHVTAMVVQAEAARYLTANPERLDQTLTAITGTGRRAISDLRNLLDLLNPEHGTEPRTPSVGELRALVEQTRQAGQPVEFTEDGTPPHTAGSTEVALYRVVQEALTNALKYAHGSRTIVHVRRTPGGTTVEVSTEAAGVRHASPGGSGRGLAGLRERVGVLGGEFSAGHGTDGGFVVRARIPAGSPS